MRTITYTHKKWQLFFWLFLLVNVLSHVVSNITENSIFLEVIIINIAMAIFPVVFLPEKSIKIMAICYFEALAAAIGSFFLAFIVVLLGAGLLAAIQ